MKKISLLLLIFAFTFSCNKTEEKKEGYVVSGTAKDVYNGVRVYLKNVDDRGKHTNRDTAIVINETFKFEGKIETPELLYLFVDGVDGNLPVMLENDNINIVVDKSDIYNSKVSGTKSIEAFNIYTNKVKELSQSRMGLNMEYRQASQKNDTATLESLKSKIDANTKEMKAYPFEFLSKNNNNYFALTLIESLVDSKELNIEDVDNAFNKLDSSIKSSVFGQKVKTKIETKKQINAALSNLEIGKIAPKFSAPSTDGSQLALDDIKGKVTIIDFWASWCGPCRRENPNVVKTYEKFHDKGLEIISVSLDKPGQKDKWLKAIKDDNLTWHHVSNLNYFNDPVARMYNIQSIPATYILDEDGKIVAKNLRGATLEQKIGELLN